MDNCGPHGAELNEPKEQMTIPTLTQNCTSLHQTIDMGIISTWKLKYRSPLIRAIATNFESAQQRRDDSAALMRGMFILAEGRNPHLLNVAKMV